MEEKNKKNNIDWQKINAKYRRISFRLNAKEQPIFYDLFKKSAEKFEVMFDFETANNDVNNKKVCPKCHNKTVQIKPKGAFCCLEGCGFVIWRVIAQKSLPDKELYLLLEKGTTKKISGFKSSKGKSFKAALKLNKDLTGVDFNF